MMKNLDMSLSTSQISFYLSWCQCSGVVVSSLQQSKYTWLPISECGVAWLWGSDVMLQIIYFVILEVENFLILMNFL